MTPPTERALQFFVASRGHHADVGGTAPGSMTPLATTVDEEGVLFDNFRIVERGRFREAGLLKLLTDHPDADGVLREAQDAPGDRPARP